MRTAPSAMPCTGRPATADPLDGTIVGVDLIFTGAGLIGLARALPRLSQ